MSTEQLPKEFEKTSEVLPFTKYGLTSFNEFKKVENDIQHLEWLKKIGLSNDEINLYQEHTNGRIEHKNLETTVLKNKLESIYRKIEDYQTEAGSSKQQDEPSTSEATDIFNDLQKKPITFYPEGHPMNEIKDLEQSLFGHLKTDIIPITKRRKILRHLERRKERILAQQKQLIQPTIDHPPRVPREGSLWDMKEAPKVKPQQSTEKSLIGPKQQTKYTIKDNKIVRLEPVQPEERIQVENNDNGNIDAQEYRAVDIIVPVNAAEEELLEGTKMCVDDIRKIERFHDYEPGVPSKVLYLKNIAPSVTQEQISLLFNQFQLENGGPVEVKLMTGRMRGQAFVSFQFEELAIQALDEINGTILSGRPVIAEFGRNSNRVQDDNR